MSPGYSILVRSLLAVSLLGICTVRRAPAAPALLKGTDASIRQLALSPDESKLAAVTDDGAVLLWDLASGELTTLAASSKATSVQFTNDGKTLLAGSLAEVTAWDVKSGAGQAAFTKATYAPRAMCSDGRRVAIAMKGGYVIYDVASQAEVLTIAEERATTSPALAAATELAALGVDGQIRLFDLAGKKELDPIRGLPDRPKLLAFHPNGKVLAVGMASETQFWDVGRLPQPPKLLIREPELDADRDLFFAATGKLVVVLRQGAPQIWDTATRKVRPEIAGSSGKLAASADGSTLVAEAADHRTVVADGATGAVRTLLEAAVPPDKSQFDAGATGAYAVSKDGSAIYIGLKTGNVEVRAAQGEGPLAAVATIAIPHQDFRQGLQGQLDFLPVGDRLLYARHAVTALIDTKTGKYVRLALPASREKLPMAISSYFVGREERKLVALYPGHTALYKFDLASGAGQRVESPREFYSLGGSADGTKVAAVMKPAGGKTQLVLLDAATGKTLGKPLLDEVDSGVRVFAFSADGKILAAALGGGVKLWNQETSEVLPLNADGTWLHLSLLDSGRTLACIDSGLTGIKLFDVESAQLKSEVELPRFHTGVVRDAAVSPVDPLFVTVGDNGEVLIRDLPTGEVLGRAVGHSGIVSAVAFSPDGKRLATLQPEDAFGVKEAADQIKIWAIDAAKLRTAPRPAVAGAKLPVDPKPAPAGKIVAEPRQLAAFDLLINKGQYPKLWFSPDNQLLIAGDGEIGYTINVQAFEIAAEKLRFKIDDGIGNSLHFSPDNKFAFSSTSGWIGSIELASGKVATNGEEHLPISRPLALADNKSFVVGLQPKEAETVEEPAVVKLDRATAKTVSASLNLRGAIVHDLAVLPDGTVLASIVQRDKTKVVCLDSATLKLLGTLHEEEGNYRYQLMLSPDGKMVALGSSYLYSTDVVKPKRLVDPPGPVSGFITGTNLAIWEDGVYNFQLFDLNTGTTRRVISPPKVPGGDRRSSHISISPRGQLLGWGTKEGEVVICDLVRDVELPPHKVHEDKVYAVSFSPDGTRLATAGAEGQVKVWSLDGTGPAPPGDSPK